MARNGQAVTAIMRRVMHDIAGGKTNAEDDHKTEHRREKRIKLAIGGGLGLSARIGGRIAGVDGLRTH